MAFGTVKQLGQLRPGDTNPASIYTPAAGVTAHIRNVVVCNNTGAAATFRLHHDEDGTTYDVTTALYYDVSVAANTTYVHEPLIFMATEGGNLAVQSGTANALTFTVYGAEET